MAASVEQLAPDSQVETTVAESTVRLRVPPSGTGMLPRSSTEETRVADADLGGWLRYAPWEPLFLPRYRTKPQEGLDDLLSGSNGLALPKPPKNKAPSEQDSHCASRNDAQLSFDEEIPLILPLVNLPIRPRIWLARTEVRKSPLKNLGKVTPP